MELECKHGDETITGPDEKSVKDAMKRHMDKKHPKAKKK